MNLLKALKNHVEQPNLFNILKGDYEGHPFRGNQWTTGAVSSEKGYTDKYGQVRQGGLTPKERKIEGDFYKRIRENKEGMIAAYRAKFGNEIDADKVKTLCPPFCKDSGYAKAAHEPSSYLSKVIMDVALAEKKASGDQSPTLFTAGGSGSGKSDTQAFLGYGKDTLIYDSVLGGDTAISKIEAAVTKSGAPVHVAYTNAKLENAVTQNAVRGRAVTLSTLVNAHVTASDQIRKIEAHFKDNPKVTVSIVNNFRGKGQQESGSIRDVPKYDRDEAYKRGKEKMDSLLASNVITQERYDQIMRKPSH